MSRNLANTKEPNNLVIKDGVCTIMNAKDQDIASLTKELDSRRSLKLKIGGNVELSPDSLLALSRLIVTGKIKEPKVLVREEDAKYASVMEVSKGASFMDKFACTKEFGPLSFIKPYSGMTGRSSVTPAFSLKDVFAKSTEIYNQNNRSGDLSGSGSYSFIQLDADRAAKAVLLQSLLSEREDHHDNLDHNKCEAHFAIAGVRTNDLASFSHATDLAPIAYIPARKEFRLTVHRDFDRDAIAERLGIDRGSLDNREPYNDETHIIYIPEAELDKAFGVAAAARRLA